MGDYESTIEELQGTQKDKPLPPDTFFLTHRLKAGDKRPIGQSMFEDYLITYTDKDIELLNNLWSELSANPETYESYIQFLGNELTESEKTFVAKAAAAIVDLNGGGIGESAKTDEEFKALSSARTKMYINTDVFRTVTLSDIKGKGIVLCAEASLIVQALSNKIDGYHVASAQVVVNADSSPEGHQINFLANKDGSRVILVDTVYGQKIETDGKNIIVPIVALLSTSQIDSLEKGQNVSIDTPMGKRVYRIGTAYTPPGTWKDNHLV